MKALIVAGLLVIAAQGVSQARQLITAQERTPGSEELSQGNSLNQQFASKRSTELKKFAPVETGVFTDLVQRGPIILSPFAPASEGMGQRYLTTNSHPPVDAYKRYPSTMEPYNGIKLFGWNF